MVENKLALEELAEKLCDKRRERFTRSREDSLFDPHENYISIIPRDDIDDKLFYRTTFEEDVEGYKKVEEVVQSDTDKVLLRVTTEAKFDFSATAMPPTREEIYEYLNSEVFNFGSDARGPVSLNFKRRNSEKIVAQFRFERNDDNMSVLYNEESVVCKGTIRQEYLP